MSVIILKPQEISLKVVSTVEPKNSFKVVPIVEPKKSFKTDICVNKTKKRRVSFSKDTKIHDGLSKDN